MDIDSNSKRLVATDNNDKKYAFYMAYPLNEIGYFFEPMLVQNHTIKNETKKVFSANKFKHKKQIIQAIESYRNSRTVGLRIYNSYTYYNEPKNENSKHFYFGLAEIGNSNIICEIDGQMILDDGKIMRIPVVYVKDLEEIIFNINDVCHKILSIKFKENYDKFLFTSFLEEMFI